MSDYRDRVARAVREFRGSGDGWLRGPCPLCELRVGTPDKHAAMGYKSSTGYWHCFRCGAAGFLRDRPEGLPEVEERGEVELEQPSDYVPLVGPGRTAIATEDARRYLLGRGIGERMWEVARIGAALSGRHSGRVILPILADDGEEWVGWVGRAWVKRSALSYYYARGMPRAETIYNHVALLRQTEDPAVVVEGVFDTFPLWPDSVAVLGKASAAQFEALVASRRPVAVVLDGDAWREGRALAMRLRLRGHRAGSVRLPPRTDPDEVDVGWLREEVRLCLDR